MKDKKDSTQTGEQENDLKREKKTENRRDTVCFIDIGKLNLLMVV
jgi:hypothetical protein